MHLFWLWLMLLCVVNVDFDITLINIVEFVQTPFGLRVRGEIAVCSPSLSNLFHTKDHAKQMRWQVFLKDYICCVCHAITATRLKSRYILSVLPSGVVSRWQCMLTIVNMSLLHFFFFRPTNIFSNCNYHDLSLPHTADVVLLHISLSQQ